MWFLCRRIEQAQFLTGMKGKESQFCGIFVCWEFVVKKTKKGIDEFLG